MYIGEKLVLRPRSFHHRIREGSGHYIDHEQFMGIDPFDQTKFHELYDPKLNTIEVEPEIKIDELIPDI